MTSLFLLDLKLVREYRLLTTEGVKGADLSCIHVSVLFFFRAKMSLLLGFDFSKKVATKH